MEELEKKLRVLSDIARVFNENHLAWAVGASMLLYFKGKTDSFHDLDLMVLEDDADKAERLLSPMGVPAPPNPNERYRTRRFLEYTIGGVEVDVLAGFVIVRDGVEYDCSLRPKEIAEYIRVNGQTVPLQSLDAWRRYYSLMGRTEKAEMIDR